MRQFIDIDFKQLSENAFLFYCNTRMFQTLHSLFELILHSFSQEPQFVSIWRVGDP